jgi:hypothetical protein
MTNSHTIFQLVRKVLDELRTDVAETYGDKTDDVIKKRLNALGSAYEKLTDAARQPVDYSSPEDRFAYVYRYVGAHSDYVFQVLNRTGKHLGKHLASQQKAVVTALGGGPGSDLVGLMRYLVDLEESSLKTVTAYLCDREQAWADCWTEIGEEESPDFKLNVNFQPLDVTDANSWSKQKKFLSADLFLLVYFASEVASLGSKAKQFWSELSARSKPGALMLIIDNNHDFFNNFISKDIIGDKWEILVTENDTLTPSIDERTTHLGEYFKLYGWPKMKGYIKYWVVQRT